MLGLWQSLTQIILPWVFAIPANVQQVPDLTNNSDWVPTHVVQACREDKDHVGRRGKESKKINWGRQ